MLHRQSLGLKHILLLNTSFVDIISAEVNIFRTAYILILARLHVKYDAPQINPADR